MWIGFGFKDDLGVFTERFYVWYSVIASVRHSAIVPEICKSVKTIETKKVKTESPNPKDDLSEHEVDCISIAVCFVADIELRDFVQSVCVETADRMKSDILLKECPQCITLIAF